MQDDFQPFVVYGPSKSGTTWLQKILDSHPEVRCHFQMQLFPFLKENGVVAVPSDVVYSKLKSPFKGVFPDAKSEKEYWIRLRYFQNLRKILHAGAEDLKTQFSNPEEQAYVDHLINESYRAITPRFVIDDSEKQVFGLKSTTDLEFLFQVFPKAKVITIIRDGRDVVTSKRFHMQKRGAFYLGDEKSKLLYALNYFRPIRMAISLLRKKFGWFGENRFKTYTNDNMKFTRASLNKFASDWALTTRFILKYRAKFPNQFHTIRYEDLKQDPGAAIKGVLTFLEVRADEKVIDEVRAATDFKKLKGKDEQNSFFRKGTTGDWENYFTASDKALFKSCSGDLLQELGYEKDQNW